jgi:hypothetical protein
MLPYYPATPTVRLILAEMPLQRLSVYLRPFAGYVDANQPLFASITHLDIFDYIPEHLTQILPHIPTFPALTHLSLDREVSRDTIENVLVNFYLLSGRVLLVTSTKRQRSRTSTMYASSECTRTTRVIGKLVQRAYRISGRARMTSWPANVVELLKVPFCR